MHLFGIKFLLLFNAGFQQQPSLLGLLPLLLLNDELLPELEGVVLLIPEGIFKHDAFVFVVDMTILGVFKLHVEKCDFLLKLTSLLLVLKAALGEFPNLHLVVLIIEDLPFGVDQSYSQ